MRERHHHELETCCSHRLSGCSQPTFGDQGEQNGPLEPSPPSPATFLQLSRLQDQVAGNVQSALN